MLSPPIYSDPPSGGGGLRRRVAGDDGRCRGLRARRGKLAPVLLQRGTRSRKKAIGFQ